MIKSDLGTLFVTQFRHLRRVLIQSCTLLAIVFLIFICYADKLYYWFSQPVRQHLPGTQTLIATGVIAPISIPIKFSFFLALYVTIPILLHFIWRFIAPGLYQRERLFIWPIVTLSVVLFYCGALFAYFVISPMLFHFINALTPMGVTYMPDIGDYLNFILGFCFNFGIAFEIPVAMMILARTRLVPYETLRNGRRYFIVLAFVIAMLLTPPDVFSQTMLAIPMCLLYELGLILSKRTQRAASTEVTAE